MMRLLRVGLAVFLVLPHSTLAADTAVEDSSARAGAVAAGVESRLAAGNVAGIYGERQASVDNGVVGRGAIGTRADANLPGHQLPMSLRTTLPEPPRPGGPFAPGGEGKVPTRSFFSRLGAAIGLGSAPEEPPGKFVDNPSFSRAACAAGETPPCPMRVMMMGENTPFAAKITDFVDYGEVDGALFSSPRWWQFWKDRKQVSSDDVRQGGLGDCFLLASLAAIANKQPDVLRNMIKRNKNTMATWVNFYEGTPPQPVFVGPVDNEFPVFKKGLKQGQLDIGGQSAFAKPVGPPPPPIWPLIVEKAYAIKFRGGSYADLNTGGLGSDAMTRITGRPSQWHVVAPKDHLFKAPVEFQDLVKWDANGQPITIGTKHQPAAGCSTAPAAEAAPAVSTAPAAEAAPAPETTDSVCTDPLYQGKIACLPGSTDPVCSAPSNQIIKLHTGHAYWVKSVDAGSQTVTLANPWGSDQPTVAWPWTRLQKSLYVVFVNDK